MRQRVRFSRSPLAFAAVSLVAQFVLLVPLASVAVEKESITELPWGLDRVKVKGFDIPYFDGGPEEDKVRIAVFKRQATLLDIANKRRPSVDDYLIALNVQLLHLHRFNEYKKHWLEKLPHQDDPRAISAAKGYIDKIFRDECLKTAHFAEDLQDMLGFEFYSRVINLNPYTQVLPIALKQIKENRSYVRTEPVPMDVPLTIKSDSFYSDTVIEGIQQLWTMADESGQIPESKKRNAFTTPFVDVQVFRDGNVKSSIHITSGSNNLDQEAIDWANKYHPQAFPPSLKAVDCVHVIVRMPFKLSKHSGIKEVSKKELEQHHMEQREIQQRDMDVKRMIESNHEKVVPWKNLIPYGAIE